MKTNDPPNCPTLGEHHRGVAGGLAVLCADSEPAALFLLIVPFLVCAAILTWYARHIAKK